MSNIEYAKCYILQEIETKGFDPNGDILIDFADICTEEETIQAAEELGYIATPAQGQGCWWISMDDAK